MNIDELLLNNIDVCSTIIEAVNKKDIEDYKKLYTSKTLTDIISGLFMGIYINDTTIYILIATSNNSITLLNATKYNIISIICNYTRESGNKYTDYIYVREGQKDQIYAQQILYKILVNYQKNKKVTSDLEIVDINKLKDYDVDITALHSEKEANTMNMHRVGSDSWSVGSPCQFPVNQNLPVIVKPIVINQSTSIIKRQSKKPTKIFLDKMLEMVKMITPNNHKLPTKTSITKVENKFNQEIDEEDDAWVNKCLSGYY